MIFIKTQPTTLKNGLMHQIVMKEEQKTVHKKTKQITIIIIIIGLLKDEKRSKLIRNFTKSAPKIYVSIVQKMIMKYQNLSLKRLRRKIACML